MIVDHNLRKIPVFSFYIKKAYCVTSCLNYFQDIDGWLFIYTLNMWVLLIANFG